MTPGDGTDREPHATLSLGAARDEVLEHAFGILRETWTTMDSPRPGQPPLSDANRALLDIPLPATGIGPDAALDEAAALLDQSLAQSRPRFLGYVGSSGLEVAVLAEALAASHDINLASDAAAASQVERQTVSWIGEFVGFGAGGGMVTSGGMLSTLTALVAARERAMPGSRRTGLVTRGTIYVSGDGHSSVERCAEILGLGSQSVRVVPVDNARRMQVPALVDALTKDVAEGIIPIAVVATAGTTLTGAVDPIAAIARVCRSHGVWLHVDGAYGLPAAAAPSTAALFTGLDEADSASVDAHKWMYVPKACSILLVRDTDALRAAYAHRATYMVEAEEYPVDRTLEYSRPFRALKLWTALRAHGAQAFIDAIEANLALARDLAARVEAAPDLELVTSPQLSTVPFARRPRTGDANSHNAAIATMLQASGDVFVTSANIDGRTVLRPCFANFRTRESDVVEFLLLVEEAGLELDGLLSAS